MTARQTTRSARPRVLLFDVNDIACGWLRDCLATVAETVVVRGAQELHDGLARGARAVISGRAFGDPWTTWLLGEVGTRVPVLLAASQDDLQAAKDERVFYVLSPSLPPGDVAALVHSAVTNRAASVPEVVSPEAAARLTRVLALASRFSSRSDLESAAATAEDAAQRLTGADRTYCVFHDADTGALWTEGVRAREGHATTGLIGFSARTKRPCAAEVAQHDPRYARALDDPEGDGGQRILVQPVIAPDTRVHAVLVAARLESRPMFSAVEKQMLATFAEKTGPMMHDLALMVEAEGVLRAEREHKEGLFRPEAVTAHGESGHRGDVVRVSPAWIHWAYWGLLWLAVVSIAYLFVGRVAQHSTGPAIVRLHTRTEVTARSGGPLVSVEVTPGQHVEAEQLLARLDDIEARAAVDQLQREFDDQLRTRLQNPSDASAMKSVFGLRGQLAAARTVLEQRELRAARAGVVSDIRIRPGQHVGVGDIVLSLLDETDQPHVIALLAGGDRPQLQPGMDLRLEVAGYRYAYQQLEIDWVSDEVIGPNEARRYLGPQVADNLEIAGPVVLVRARLPDGSFDADGDTFLYHDGMLATAEVAIRTEPIIVTLFPFLKRG